ncbi:MAG: Hsp70 family protein [Acidimicrobiia bacterium]
MSWAIGIDFGTSRSSGAMAGIDDRSSEPSTGGLSAISASTLEIEGSRWVPSMVLLTPEGELAVGTAAENLAGVYPERLERTPKRSLGAATPLLLGGEPVDARDGAAAVMRAIVAEGRLRSGGDQPSSAVLTHPVRWADARRDALVEAGRRAGLEQITLVEEPVAAAIHYAAAHVDIGAHVGVYDLGGGTFDTAILQRTAEGFEVIGVPGGDENIGGEDFDHRLFRYFGACLAEDQPELWERLLTDDDRRWKRAALDLLTQARRAKEALSSFTSTQVFVPIADRDIMVNRSQFESMIIDDVERTVDLMEDTVVDAGLSIEDLAAVFLVGGSSRMPLVSQLVTERFGDRVVTRDEPKSVVALGAARLAALRAGATAGSAAPSTPVAHQTANLGVSPTENLGVSPTENTPQPPQTLMPPMAPPPRAPLAPPTLRDPSPPPPQMPVPPAPQAVTVAWRLAVSQPPGRLNADAHGVVFGSGDTSVTSVDPRSGQLVWQQSIGAGVWAAPALSDQIVAVGGLDGRVAVLERSSGAMRWAVSTGAAVVTSPCIVGDVVIVGNDGGRLLALDQSSGRLRWELPVGAAIRGDLVADGEMIVVTNVAGQVLLTEVATGVCRWGYRTGGSVLQRPALTVDRVLVASEDGYVHGLRRDNGSALFGVRCTNRPTTAVVLDSQTFTFADDRGVIRTHRIDTGQMVKEIATVSTQVSGLVVHRTASSSTVIAETGGSLVGMDSDTGAARFVVPTGQGNRSVPVLSGGLVVIATTFGQIYAVVAP